jgi:hypothetical protein
VIIDILGDKALVVSCADGCLVADDYEIIPNLTKEEKIYFKIGNKLESSLSSVEKGKML